MECNIRPVMISLYLGIMKNYVVLTKLAANDVRPHCTLEDVGLGLMTSKTALEVDAPCVGAGGGGT